MTDLIEHEGVEGLRVGRFPGQINTTCIVYRLGATVVDVGPPNQWRQVRRFLAERAIRQVLATHHHEDHSGNLASVRELAEAVYAPAASLGRLDQGFPLRPYQLLVWGRPERCRPEPVPEEVPLDDGGTLRTVAAPGHSDDMTCYLEPVRGWLFTGDLYISSRTKYLRRDEDLRDELASLRRVLALDFDTIFCSHRGALTSGKEKLRAKLDFLESLCARVRHLRGEGRGVAEITRALLGREDLTAWMTGFHFSKRNLIRACFDVLEDQSSTDRSSVTVL